MCILVLKMKEARFWPKMKFEPIFFQILWQFVNPKGSLLRAGGKKKGAPALQILDEVRTFFDENPNS
ncbi:MAG: hypothetical protein A3C55_01560 [Gammaproteobacteria bacterium RIFCSPHIGHO2_02_FULL_42_13]|nr:MAG: hypothetical protein A3C55_01560 [Gammaproteobacteria bacterium RIFCSPHIGHO2_02_FULL_42_13]